MSTETRKRTVRPVGDTVVNLRMRQGLTQGQLARRARISKRTIERVEGSFEVFPSSIGRVADALGVSLEELVTDEPSPSPESTSAEKCGVEITIEVSFDSFGPDEQAELLSAIAAATAARVDEFRIVSRRRGSVKLTLLATPQQAAMLEELAAKDALAGLGVTHVRRVDVPMRSGHRDLGHYTLLTGATGLLGRYVLRDFLVTGHRVATLVRPSRRASAQERIEAVCQHFEAELGQVLPRPVVLAGSITDPLLGLSVSDVDWVATHCYRMMHVAGILEFFGEDREREPWRTNVGGTQRVIDLCRETGLTEMHYVSTAYVAGIRPDRIMEDDLIRTEFRNNYEESKFEAEQLIREADCFDRPTVYRPAVIAGDYHTGYTLSLIHI